MVERGENEKVSYSRERKCAGYDDAGSLCIHPPQRMTLFQKIIPKCIQVEVGGNVRNPLGTFCLSSFNNVWDE